MRASGSSAAKLTSIPIVFLLLAALMLAAFIIVPQPVQAAQFGRPDSDVETDDWTTTPLWSKIDEGSPGDDVYIVSPGDPTDTDADSAELTLSDVTDPVSSTGHIIRAEWHEEQTGGGPASVIARLRLYQGDPDTGTLIGTLQATVDGGTDVTDTYTLTAGEADSITDYTDLYFDLTADGSVGGAWTISLYVDIAELEVPDAPTEVTCQDLTVVVNDPAGQLWFNGTTDTPPGGLWQEENVSASFQTDSTPAINVTNDDTLGACDVTLTLLTDPGTGRTMKFNTTNSAPNPGANSVPISPTNVTAVSGLGSGATQSIWLWVDYDDSEGGTVSPTLRVDTVVPP